MFSEESVEEIWSRLALFQSRDVLERRYRAHHGGELTASKADEIIAHLQQARQYFQSAESAGVLAGPLEQYYGVLPFARGIVLYREPKQREANLKRSHGLEAAMPGNAGPEDIQNTVTQGSFQELLGATGNSETVAIDQPSPRPNHRRSAFRPEAAGSKPRGSIHPDRPDFTDPWGERTLRTGFRHLGPLPLRARSYLPGRIQYDHLAGGTRASRPRSTENISRHGTE